ncbi:MAG: hypothetical protein RL754_437 [Bacteroidota bacterium]|jgi:hypothetical protein
MLGKTKFLLLALAMIIVPEMASGQCSMCKAVAETANGGGIGTGINYGILYLMIFPYLIISAVAYRLYRARKAAK